MKTLKKIKLVAILIAIAGLFSATTVSATSIATDAATWGPERETFTWESPASYRTFNSITDNPSLGDERNFVRIRQVDDDKYVDQIDAVANTYYEVYVYYHNNAGANLNESGKGVANNVYLTMSIPATVKQGSAAEIKGTITASNTEPESVWDTAFLTAKDYDITISYVDQSAIVHSSGTVDGQGIDGVALLGDGVKLGYWENQPGIVPGCNEYAGYVTFELLVTTDEVPTTTTTTEEEPTPTEMPETGPGEIILATVVVIAVIGGIAYFIHTRKILKKTLKKVK